MNRTQLEKEAIRLYTKANKSQKWFSEEINGFKAHIKAKPIQDLRQSVVNMKCLAGENINFNKEVDRLESELEKAGMYDIRNMKPQNALD